MFVFTQAIVFLILCLGGFAEDVLISNRVRYLKKRDGVDEFKLSFYHINDVHAHLDQFVSSSGNDCTNASRGCVGGYARVKNILDTTRDTHENSLFLNAGDEFQGTLFYTYYKGEKIAETLNQLGVDAMTLGNHEFDGGDDQLGAFLENLTFPIISANVKSGHPVLNRTIKPFEIFDAYDLAVIGVTVDSSSLSSPGNTTTFSDPIKAVQDTIDEIHATTDVTRIVALTHIGYEADIELARKTTGLSLIMGGHSHTPLGNMTATPAGPYPTIVNNTAGEEVFVVTAWRWGEVLGYIDLTWDCTNRIVEYHGAPFRLDNTTAQDPGLQSQITAWRAPFEKFAAEVLGQTQVELAQSTCQSRECLLGDFMADAAEAYGKTKDAKVSFALINAGGVRAPIPVGPVTRGQVLNAFPFGNAITQLSRTGAQLENILEGIVSKVNLENGKVVTSFLQISAGLRISYSPTAATGSRLQSVTIGGQPLNPAETYSCVTLDYLAGGGDNFFVKSTDYITLDLEADVLVQYFQARSPVNVALDGRIKAV